MLERICEAYLFSPRKLGAPPVLAGALDMNDDERAKVDEIWQATTDQFKKLELRHTTNANAEIAAESAANLAESRQKVRAKMAEENLAPDELEARMQEFERLMTYNESGHVKLHIDSAALYENAASALDSLHASLTTVLTDSARASLVTEAFVRLYLGTWQHTPPRPRLNFLFGTDEAHLDTHAIRFVGTEITDGQEITSHERMGNDDQPDI